jgi:glycosyltransferase involved in cell wall biosynthesis
MQGLSITIPTYNRVHLLEGLLSDLTLQTVQPACLIVVDGNPNSGEVLARLEEFSFPAEWQVKYIPSHLHANAAFQRYLGWRLAQGCDVLVFIDDDIRIADKTVLNSVVSPLLQSDDVVGVTPIIDFPNAPALRPISPRHRPGGLTPVGNRIPPRDTNQPYSPVLWARGGMMAFRMDAIEDATFSRDMFALAHIKCGIGDDTAVSQQMGAKGQLLQANHAHIQHPSLDVSRAYPHIGWRRGYAQAYSRRFLNDTYRVTGKPQFSDRLVLLRSLGAGTALGWWRALRSRQAIDFAYAWGYTVGTLRAIFQKPTTKNLTPSINWEYDAEETLTRTMIIQQPKIEMGS